MAEEKRAETPQENPATKSGSKDPALGHYKSIEAKERSLANLKPPFKVGHPALPGAGRPRMDGPATKELRKMLRARFPNDPKGRSYLRLMIEGLLKSAIRGNTFAAELIFERIEGRVPLPVDHDLPCTIVVQVNRNTQRYPEIDPKLLLEGNTSKAND